LWASRSSNRRRLQPEQPRLRQLRLRATQQAEAPVQREDEVAAAVEAVEDEGIH
jgi:hypothetical protein